MLDLIFGRSLPSRTLFVGACGAVFAFLLGPLLVIIPLSFNSEPYLTFPIAGWSARWYAAFFTTPNWLLALKNSFIVATATAALSAVLGTAAALGLQRLPTSLGRGLTGLLLLPMVLPLVVSAVGIYFAYARVGLTNSLAGLILAHSVIASPFVLVTVQAGLARLDPSLLRAAASLGAGEWTAFRRVLLPSIRSSVASGTIFAFVASFDDVVIALFIASTEQRTLPRQMWSGVRENLDPTILSVATLLVVLSAVVTLATVWLGQRRPQR
jgi:putative spermidine/putrescine transport system permease protein